MMATITSNYGISVP